MLTVELLWTGNGIRTRLPLVKLAGDAVEVRGEPGTGVYLRSTGERAGLEKSATERPRWVLGKGDDRCTR